MVRQAPFRTFRLDEETCRELEEIRDRLVRAGSFNAFVNEILKKYTKGMLVETQDGEGRKVRRVLGARGEGSRGQTENRKQAS